MKINVIDIHLNKESVLQCVLFASKPTSLLFLAKHSNKSSTHTHSGQVNVPDSWAPTSIRLALRVQQKWDARWSKINR